MSTTTTTIAMTVSIIIIINNNYAEIPTIPLSRLWLFVNDTHGLYVFLQCPRSACRWLVLVTWPEEGVTFSTKLAALWRSSAKWSTPVATTDPKCRGTEDDRPFRAESPRGKLVLFSADILRTRVTWLSYFN